MRSLWVNGFLRTDYDGAMIHVLCIRNACYFGIFRLLIANIKIKIFHKFFNSSVVTSIVLCSFDIHVYQTCLYVWIFQDTIQNANCITWYFLIKNKMRLSLVRPLHICINICNLHAYYSTVKLDRHICIAFVRLLPSGQ